MKALLLITIAVLLVVQSLAQPMQRCPNNCNSPNGSCLSTGGCLCNAGWLGTDCSIPHSNLESGRPVLGRVSQGAWNMYVYSINANTPHSLRLEMGYREPTSADADMYLKIGTSLPSRTDYDYADTGIARVAILNLPARSTHTLYTLGIYGFTTVSNYSLLLNGGSAACPGNCHGHGTCRTDGHCDCNMGWAGPSCNVSVPLMPNGRNYFVIDRNEWKYNYMTIHAGTTGVHIVVNQTHTTGDVDVYVKKGSIPTFSNFDYADSGTDLNFVVNIPTPEVGAIYYVGFYGFRATTAYVEARVQTSSGSCPNACSGHGTCNAGMCHCNSDFTGTNCGQMNRLLHNGESVLGHVDSNVWNYFSARGFSTAPLTVELRHGQRQDCDLYIQRNTNPTRFDYLYRDITLDNPARIVIPNPLDSEWKIGVMGYGDPCDYNISAYSGTTNQCPAECIANGGQCPDRTSTCICPPNRAGPTCRSSVTPIGSGQTMQGSLRPNEWAFYVYRGPASAFSVILHEDLPNRHAGVLWVYVSVVKPPELDNYDWADTSTNTLTHRVTAEFDHFFPQAQYYIGVYGSPFAVSNSNPYKLTTWAAPFKK